MPTTDDIAELRESVAMLEIRFDHSTHQLRRVLTAVLVALGLLTGCLLVHIWPL